jgi:diguanylate cyclase (GGDEF)-like protein
MSMRTRLAIVLAAVMIGPLVAAWLAVGVLVPTVSRGTERASLDRSAGAVSLALAGRCRAVGELARSVAQQLTTDVLAGGGRTVTTASAREAAADAAARSPRTAVAVLADGGSGAVLAAAGGGLGDPAAVAPSVLGASCAAGSVPAGGPDALAENVPVVLGGHRVASVVAWMPVDDASLARLARELGVTDALALLRAPVGRPVQVAAATVPRSDVGTVPDEISGLGRPGAPARPAGTAGTADGLRYSARPAQAGAPYAVLAVARFPGQAWRATLGLVLLVGALAALALVAVLSGRLTGRLVELTRIAERLGSGELGARSGIEGDDEVGRLAGAMDAMAGELQNRLMEVERSRDALADTFERFGEALGRTHDLDGLLRTIAEAALRGADAVVATALLGDGQGLEQRVCASDVAAAPAVTEAGAGEPVDVEGAARNLTRLARAAVAEAGAVRDDGLAGLGPAVALPMIREGRVVGALTVARPPGAPGFDDTALAAVGSLAAHAGTAVGNVLAHEETRRLSVTDPLTGVGNMRQLSTTLSREVERASRFGHQLSVLMLDLDHFKQVNDNHGHAFGDVVLREFARRLTDCVREVDMVARYGGEEFAVVLPETDADGASRVAERVLQAARSQPFGGHADREGQPQDLTVSIGVASFPAHGRGAAELIRSADGALYAAKRTGRDRWCVAGVSGDARVVPQAG